MNKPLVSAIMSVYNEKEENLYLSIKSILNQDYPNIEIILIDDGSDKEIVLPKHILSRITFLKNDINMGLAYSLNKALKNAKGKYILRVDSDDFLLKERTSTQVNFLERNNSIDLVGTSLFIIDKNNKLLGIRSIIKYHELLYKSYWKEVPIPHPSWLVRKEALNYKYQTNLKRGQDQFFLITNSKDLKYHVISKPLNCYRLKNISIINRYRGRISIIMGVKNNKNLLHLFFSIFFHSSAIIRDILYKILGVQHKIWNVNYNEIDNLKYNNELDNIKKIYL